MCGKDMQGNKGLYFKMYFRIRSEYAGSGGWSSETDKNAFENEINNLFSDAGWDIQKGRTSGSCDSAVRGKESLYLHPMFFSGVILGSSAAEIEQILNQGKTFHWLRTEKHEPYYDMTEAEYLQRLEEKRPEMENDFLTLYQTKRRNLYITGDAVERLIRKYRIHRVEEEYEDTVLNGLLLRIRSELVEKGEIIQAETRNGEGYRTATEKDRF